MKICAIICEYNPFHNGHKYLIEQARKKTDCDGVLCLMSGNFVQRGEAAILSKYVRARHAVLAGADAVVELPAVFATSPAELFAKGGLWLLSAIPEVKYLAFGCESGEKMDFLRLARLMNREPPEVSASIQRRMQTGDSYAKARAEAWKEQIPDAPLFSPNDILAVEYARAVEQRKADVSLIPVERLGGGYADKALNARFSSSGAIRAALSNGKDVSDTVPPYVCADLRNGLSDRLPVLEKLALLQRSAKEVAKTCDCTEGLENALKRAAEENLPDVAGAIVSRRYTASRIRRILLQNLLQIEETFIRECLDAPLYFRVLAIRKERTDLLSLLGNSEFPLLARAGDEKKLTGVSRKCFQTDRFADEIFSLARNFPPEEKNIFL